MNRHVTIVIPCLNEEKYIGKCLESIVACRYDKQMLQVFVCDGMSSDKSASIIRNYQNRHGWIRLLENPDRSTPKALNLGIKSSSSDIVIILGAHAEIHPDYVDNCVREFQRDPKIGCVGGIIENIPENHTAEIISAAMSSSFGVGNAYFRTAEKDGYVDTVAFGAYSRDVFDKAGLFDEELVRNQDDEFNYRLHQAGFLVYLSHSIRSKYYVRASFKKLFRQYYQYGYWKVYVNKKHGAITTWRQMVPPVFCIFLYAGLILSAIVPLFTGLYAAGILLYLVTGCLFAARKSKGPIMTLEVLYAFLILHISYGTGYLEGILRFMLLGKKPHQSSMKLSR